MSRRNSSLRAIGPGVRHAAVWTGDGFFVCGVDLHRRDVSSIDWQVAQAVQFFFIGISIAVNFVICPAHKILDRPHPE